MLGSRVTNAGDKNHRVAFLINLDWLWLDSVPSRYLLGGIS